MISSGANHQLEAVFSAMELPAQTKQSSYIPSPPPPPLQKKTVLLFLLRTKLLKLSRWFVRARNASAAAWLS